MSLPRVKQLIAILVAILMGGLASYFFTTPGLKPVIISVYQPPIISPEQVTHDLGTIKTDSKVDYTFVLYNLGGQVLKISGADASCGCTVVDVKPKIVPPGDLARLKVTLDTSTKLGAIKKKIRIFSNDPKHPELALYLKANVIQQMMGHKPIAVKDPYVLFKGQCATCHVMKGKGKMGKALFQADCAMCHGLQGQGAVAMALNKQNYDDPKTEARLRKVLEKGSPNTPEMPPFSHQHGGPLTDPEIDSLMNFLKFQAMQAKSGQPTVNVDVEE